MTRKLNPPFQSVATVGGGRRNRRNKVYSCILFFIFLSYELPSVQGQDHKTLNLYNSASPEISATGSITLLPGFFVPAGSSFRAYISAEVAVPLAAAPSPDQNYIITYSPRVPITSTSQYSSATIDEVQQTIQYFDGLGRPLQTVQTKGSPDRNKDIVVANYYDQYGRESRSYLPFASVSNNGSYKAGALDEVVAYYQSQPAGMTLGFSTPYSQREYEKSPLSRVLEQGAPGNGWQPSSSSLSGSGHTVKTEHGTNANSEVLDWGSKCYRYQGNLSARSII